MTAFFPCLVFLRGMLAAHAALALENALLRHQIAVLQRSVKRPELRRRDRMLWILVRALTVRWRGCLLIVQPETVVRWHREACRCFWRWKSRGGRPAIGPDLRALVRRIAAENPLWGVPRIQAELAMLGHRLAKATISKYAGRLMPRPNQSWRTFIRNHMGCTAAMDLFTVPTALGRTLYGHIILSHDRRRVEHFNVTEHPTAAWIARQIMQAFPFDSAPRFLVHDNDGCFGDAVTATLRTLRIRSMRTSPGSPWQNAFAERFIGSLRRECLDHVIVLSERHLLTVVGEYVGYYNSTRPHQSLGGDAPDRRQVDTRDGPVIATPILGGLHHRYSRAA